MKFNDRPVILSSDNAQNSVRMHWSLTEVLGIQLI